MDTARQQAHKKTQSDTMHKTCVSPSQTHPRIVRHDGHILHTPRHGCYLLEEGETVFSKCVFTDKMTVLQ